MADFVDSNVFIYAFTNNHHKEKCRELLTKEDLVTNTLVLLETYAKITTIRSESYAKDVVKGILSSGNIMIVDFSNNLFFESVKRQAKYRLKISDLVHYITSLLNNCSRIVSYDSHFDNLEIERSVP